MSKQIKALINVLLFLLFGFAQPVLASDKADALSLALNSSLKSKLPLIAGPGVSPEQLSAYSEAHGLITLSDYLEANRPGLEMEQQLRSKLGNAQKAWITGVTESARLAFQEVTQLALLADWREQQREAIHYAFLRLAQTSQTPVEKEDWLQKAASAFPDLSPDPELFPPPILKSYLEIRARSQKTALEFIPSEHFPGYRFLVLNGKTYEIKPELKLRLTSAKMRVSAYSDHAPPVSEILTPSQLQLMRVNLPSLAFGTCESPSLSDLPKPVTEAAVLFPESCLRIHQAGGWKETDQDRLDLAEFQNAIQQPLHEDGTPRFPFPKEMEIRPSISRKSWLWIGLSALALGAAYAVNQEMNRDRRVEPVHHTGF